MVHSVKPASEVINDLCAQWFVRRQCKEEHNCGDEIVPGINVVPVRLAKRTGSTGDEAMQDARLGQLALQGAARAGVSARRRSTTLKCGNAGSELHSLRLNQLGPIVQTAHILSTG